MFLKCIVIVSRAPLTVENSVGSRLNPCSYDENWYPYISPRL